VIVPEWSNENDPGNTFVPCNGATPNAALAFLSYLRGNASPILKLFLSRIDELIARIER
jgi:hypothetical protein